MLRDFADQGRRTLQRHDYPGALFASASPGSRDTVFSAPAASGALAGVVGTLNGQPRPAQVAQQCLADDGDAMLAAAYSELAFGPGYFDRERQLRPANLLGGWHGGELLGGCC